MFFNAFWTLLCSDITEAIVRNLSVGTKYLLTELVFYLPTAARHLCDFVMAVFDRISMRLVSDYVQSDIGK